MAMKAEAKQGRRVRILPAHLINRIAAGEVVERPASVVKELVENALDAGAMRIDIMAGAAGRTIRVADNGCGMHPDDAAMAFYNHATSKIRDADDLDRITTLGFRGEALASIGAISKLTCLTRTPDASKGTRVTLDEAGEPVLSETGCAAGTVMEVADLFYNTPARLKFLKRAATELGHIEETVQYLALSHPEVRFSLRLNDKEVLKTSGGGELKRTIEEIFNLQRENIRLVPVTAEDPETGLTLAGFVSEPGVMKSSKRWMIMFVNGRHVRCGILQKSVEAAYESLLPHGKYPLTVLFLNLPPAEVDVNVHPTKREVRYAAASTIFGFTRTGIRASLSAQGISLEPPPLADGFIEERAPFGTGSADDFAFPGRASAFEATLQSGPAFQPSVERPFSSDPAPRNETGVGSGFAYPAMGAESGGNRQEQSWRPEQPLAFNRIATGGKESQESIQAAFEFYRPEPIDGGEPRPEMVGSASPAQRFKVIGQLFNTYILLETIQGLMVVDQHIASERTFFEILTRNLTAETPAVQHLLTARPLTVSPLQAELLMLHQADFARLGFLYELNAGDAVANLKGFPLIYEGRDGMFTAGGLFESLLAQLEETEEMKPDLDHMIATLSCHTAVRAGDPLTHDEMRLVIERWLACTLPWTCPHGRPIAHTISKGELNHFFHRPSLPVNAI